MSVLRKEFYYLRHGQTKHNALNLTTLVDENPPLTPLGIQQAQAVNPFICKLPIQTICYSPMIRAIQTMQIAADQLSVTSYEIGDLKECNGPTWEQMTASLTTQDVLTFYKQTVSGFNQALSYPGPVLIVAHGGIHFALCSQLQIQNHVWKIDNCHLVHFLPHGESEWIAKILN